MVDDPKSRDAHATPASPAARVIPLPGRAAPAAATDVAEETARRLVVALAGMGRGAAFRHWRR